MRKTFVIGDIHGAHRALVQCLERSGFDYDNDHLISLGDVCDGWPESRQALDELLKIKNLTYILGNHDYWTLEWMRTGIAEEVWTKHGGIATMQSYTDGVPDDHISFLERARHYYHLNNKLFVHAGIHPQFPVHLQGPETFLFDRELARKALNSYQKATHQQLTNFEEIYIGHTPIPFPHPIKGCEVWMLDTGAGWSGVLSMMDIETKEFFMSDQVPSLYPGVEGRRRL